MTFNNVVDLTVAAIALFAWRAAVRTHRGSYRPLLRPVVLGDYRSGAIALKNYGKGPAIAIKVWRPSNDQVLGAIDVVEPLGAPLSDPPDESRRIGRVELRVRPALEASVWYRLSYQDLGGYWHETRFKVAPSGQQFEMKHSGRLGWLTASWLPRNVRDAAQIGAFPE